MTLKHATRSKHITWAEILGNQLVKSGLRHFCIAPGSRATPLVTAIAEHPLSQTHVHFDERGLGFFALGKAKGIKAPVAVITTSGSAVSHLYPAVLEARAMGVPLLILSADRPPELRDCGANQTCRQTELFGPNVLWHFDLPCEQRGIDPSFITSVAAHAVEIMQSPQLGPVHINCMFREPFAAQEGIAEPIYKQPPLPASLSLDKEPMEQLALELMQYKQGIVVASEYSNKKVTAELLTLCRKLQWPLLTDITSPARSIQETNYHCRYGEHLPYPFEQVECVVQIGDRLVSKHLEQCIAQADNHLLVTEQLQRRDPQGRCTQMIRSNIFSFVHTLSTALPGRPPNHWLPQWHAIAQEGARAIEAYCAERYTNDALNEVGLFHMLSTFEALPQTIFVGNSTPIRSANALFFPKTRGTVTHANRGVSGIDGLIATSAGLAEGTKQPVLAIIGDMSALHDLNSMALLSQTNYPVGLIIINNNGGGIFGTLPIADNTALFETYFKTPHGYTFSTAAKCFSLRYAAVQTRAILETTLAAFLELESSFVIELNVQASLGEEMQMLKQRYAGV